MDSLIISAASGMRSRMEALDLLANNLANAATAGFKLDRESYGLYTAPEASANDAPDPSTLPVVERHWTDFAQGSLTNTGNPLDVALSSGGFFSVNGPGGTLYTRNGSFQVSTAGELTSGEGFPVRAVGGGTIKVQPNLPVEIAPDGAVSQGAASVGRIEVTEFARPEALAKFGKNCFEAGPEAGPRPAVQASMAQGKLEVSNVSAPETAVRLVNIMRQFEMLQKAITLGGDMSRHAIEEVAKV
ncbi:MAG TPA: flagellar hook-basal body complex protein [Bryobacteraceae bacterium]